MYQQSENPWVLKLGFEAMPIFSITVGAAGDAAVVVSVHGEAA